MTSYSDAELHLILRQRLDNLDSTSVAIEALGHYFRLFRAHADIFIDEMRRLLDACGPNLNTQISLIYLTNEILQRETPDIVGAFTPMLEHMMIKAAETQNQEHIAKAKRVLMVLCYRKILDAQFQFRVLELMDSHAKTGADEDVALADQFAGMTGRLVAAKRVRLQAIEAKAPDSELRRALADEKKVRDEIIDFSTRHLAEQMAKARELERAVQKSAAPKVNPVLEALGDDDDLSALL
jgi:hypothetical protein